MLTIIFVFSTFQSVELPYPYQIQVSLFSHNPSLLVNSVTNPHPLRLISP